MSRFALVLVLCACPAKDDKPKPPPPTPTPPAIDAAVAVDWTVKCEAALKGTLAPVRKLTGVIDNCQPCGDWKPLLEWNTAPEAAIRDAMDACKAYCTNDAKTVFTGLISESREKSNKPWRTLGDKCGEAVSAVPDARFMSAPYFALDRIARAAAADAKLGPLLATLELPLPALSQSGVGYELPTAAVMNPDVPRVHVTVTAGEIRVGKLPAAKLTDKGVVVDHGATPYPGELATAKDLRGKLEALVKDAPTKRVLVIAPKAMAASRVLDVVKAAGAVELVLAVAASGGPPGWTLPGTVPIVLDAKPSKAFAWKLDANVDAAIADLKTKPAEAFDHPKIQIAKDATVAHLATLLGALAFRDAKAASLTP